MKWYGITGSWRLTSKAVENDVRKTVKQIIQNGNGIVTGGALNVDWFAVDEALKLDSKASYIRVYIPASLERYAFHYKTRAKEGVITSKQAESLIDQLTRLKEINHSALIELEDGRPIDKESYYDRNSAVVEASDELIAFQVNQSQGVQDTIDKAKLRKIPVSLFSYTLS